MSVPSNEPPFVLRRMTVADIDKVMAIELLVYPFPWTAEGYRYDLTENQLAYYEVLTYKEQVIGYVGYWLMADEVHISTIAVHPNWQRQGLGELLLLNVIRHAYIHQAYLVTLEVRRSNLPAQSLYQKQQFALVGERKAYYPNNREDALIMTLFPLDERHRTEVEQQWIEQWQRLRTVRPSVVYRVQET